MDGCLMEPLLSVRGLVKDYPIRNERGQRAQFRAIEDVSLDLPPGGAVGIVGQSGSGKTTTARIIAGLERQSAGEILMDGRVVTRGRGIGFGRRVQMVFQDPYSSLDPRQRVGDAIDEVVRLHHGGGRRDRRGRVDDLLAQVGLDAHHASRLPRDLSGGQRQRVAIARALAPEPEILILDEAVAALDVSVQAQVLNLLLQIREQRGLAYLFVSHDLAVIRQTCDTAVVMRQGAVVESGPTARIIDSPQHEYTQALIAAIPRPGWRPPARSRVSSFEPTTNADSVRSRT